MMRALDVVLTSINDIQPTLRPFDNTSDLQSRSKKEFVKCLSIDDYFDNQKITTFFKHKFLQVYIFTEVMQWTRSLL